MERIFWLIQAEKLTVGIFLFGRIFSEYGRLDSVFCSMNLHYQPMRRRGMNYVQIKKLADIFSDMAQVTFAAYFIPFFLGQLSFLAAFCGALLSVLLWYVSIYFIRRCQS